MNSQNNKIIRKKRFEFHGDYESTMCGIADLLEEFEEMKRRKREGIPFPENGPCMPKYRTIKIIAEDGAEIRIDDGIPYRDEVDI